MSMTTTTERLGSVKARQIIWTDADKRATAGLTDDDLVTTYTEVTPFGRYLVAIEPAGTCSECDNDMHLGTCPECWKNEVAR